MSSTTNIIIAALYKFTPLPDYKDLRGQLLTLCEETGIRGTLLLAQEGINGTVAGSRESIDNLHGYLLSDPRFYGLEYKESPALEMPFHRIKVRLKKEIVTLGVPGTDPNRISGIRVGAKQWNELINDPDVLVIDARNQYEFDIGTFKNAVSPETDSFTELPGYVKHNLDPAKHKKIAMFCTGGIRCEKASAYMIDQGFEQVYQLQGGILKYLEQVQPQENLWHGECFVFDGRVAVDKTLQPGGHRLCYSCRHPVSPAARKSEKFEQGVSCPRCHDSITDNRRAGLRERQRQVELAEQRNQLHVGATMPRHKKPAEAV